jgi:hypothetical protein
MPCSLRLVRNYRKFLTNNLIYKGALANIRLPQYSNVACKLKPLVHANLKTYTVSVYFRREKLIC